MMDSTSDLTNPLLMTPEQVKEACAQIVDETEVGNRAARENVLLQTAAQRIRALDLGEPPEDVKMLTTMLRTRGMILSYDKREEAADLIEFLSAQLVAEKDAHHLERADRLRLQERAEQAELGERADAD